MEDIKMTATKAQYAKLKPELDAAFSSVMASMGTGEGRQVEDFAERINRYLQVAHTVPCASGADALELALRTMQLPAGAEVILPAFGYEALPETVRRLNLKPVFADVDADTFTLAPQVVESKITAATAAIIPIHLFGQCAPMQELMALASKYKLWVLEDVTQALGAVYIGNNGVEQRAGSIGHLGYTSFYPTKPSAESGEAGAVFTNHPELAERMTKMAQGSQHNFSTQLESLQAAMLDVKIKYLDEYNSARLRVASFYDEALGKSELIQVPQRTSFSSHTFHQYTIKVNPALRDGLQQHLYDNFIPSAVYYPQPLHLLKEHASLGYKSGDLPVAEQLCQSVLSLPMHSELKEDQLGYICQHVLEYVSQHG